MKTLFWGHLCITTPTRRHHYLNLDSCIVYMHNPPKGVKVDSLSNACVILQKDPV